MPCPWGMRRRKRHSPSSVHGQVHKRCNPCLLECMRLARPMDFGMVMTGQGKASLKESSTTAKKRAIARRLTSRPENDLLHHTRGSGDQNHPPDPPTDVPHVHKLTCIDTGRTPG